MDATPFPAAAPAPLPLLPARMRRAAPVVAMAVALAAAFLVLADAVLRRSAGLAAFDAAAESALDRLPDAAERAVALVGSLGDPVPAGLAVVAVVAGFALARRGRLAGAWLAAVAGNGAWTWALKRLVARTRPIDDITGVVLSTTPSFPSAHSAGMLVACGMLAYLVARDRSAGVRVAAALAAGLAVAAAGASRVLADHHHASDVVASVLSGGAWLAVCAAAVAVALPSAVGRVRAPAVPVPAAVPAA